MHNSALETGKRFFDTYWRSGLTNVLDIGSLDINGSLRGVKPPHSIYVGVDLFDGPGVDIVLNEDHLLPFPPNSFDMIVSTSCFEHDPCFWETFLQMVEVVKPGGFIYINAPINGWYHAHPLDCWRFYPDSGLALEAFARRRQFDLSLVESFICGKKDGIWSDFAMIFGKSVSYIPETRLFEQDPISYNIRALGVQGMLKIDSVLDDLRHITNLETIINRLNG